MAGLLGFMQDIILDIGLGVPHNGALLWTLGF
jgi:hypothetical protein